MIDLALALWLSSKWAVAFYLMLRGHSIFEPNRWVCLIEYIVAVITTLWFAWQPFYFFSKMKARTVKPCDSCTINLEQAILNDEVTCYRTCKEWQDWKEGRLERLEEKLKKAQ